MYYNIKIITPDSELGLESNDKLIIEREMDLYFARIFGASKEFVADIKPVKISKPVPASLSNVIIKKNDKTVVIQNDNTQINKTIEKQNITANINAIQADYQQQNKEIQINSKPQQNIENIPDKSNNFRTEIQIEDSRENDLSDINNVFYNHEQKQNPIPDVSDKTPVMNDGSIDIEKLFDQESAAFGNIEEQKEEALTEKELEKEAQALFNQLQQEVEKDSEQSNNTASQDEAICDFEEKHANTESKTVPSDINVQLDLSKFKDDTESSDFQDIIDVYKEKNNNQAQSNALTEKFIDQETVNMEIKADTEIKSEQKDNSSDAKVELQSNEIYNTEDDKFEDKDNRNNISSNNTAFDANIIRLSFDQFLSGFGVTEIHDEFLICASYIKNILKQSDFSMKTINSNLFSATGKIADTSVVDELIQKEYIKTVIADDFVKYTITPKGEQYLASKLPG